MAACKRIRAWLLLATFVASLASAQLNAGHLEIIDTACGDVGLSTGTDVSRLDAPSKPGPQHCVVCHYLRAVSGASTSSVAAVALQDGLAIEFAASNRIPPAAELITLPSRGPPALTPTNLI